MKYDIDMTGLDSLKRKLVPQIYREPMAEMFQTIAAIGERTAKQRAPRDTGALKRSIHSDARPMSARIFSNKAYAKPVEFGRRKGARMPPPNALRGWARRKLGNPNLAFVLARAIARRGIKGRFFMKAAHQAIMIKMPFQMKLLEKKVAERFGSGWVG